MTRAKFKLMSISSQQLHVNGQLIEVRTLKLSPVYGDGENAKFYAATPTGSIELGLTRPEVWSQFELGKEYYVDLSVV